MSEYSNHIILDNGTDSIKAGFNGEFVPRCVIPSVIGKSKNEKINLNWNENKTSYGKTALTNSTNLDLNYPIQNGKVKDFEALEKLWSYIFTNELKTKPESHNILLTESLFSSNSDRDKIAQIMFEKFSVFHICIEPQPLLTFHYSNKNSGLIVETGESYTQVIPIFEKFIIPQGIKFSNVSGSYLTNVTKEIFDKRLSKFNLRNKSETAKKIKEKFMKVNVNSDFINNLKGLDFPCSSRDISLFSDMFGKSEAQSASTNFNVNCNKNKFTLPDGNALEFGDELDIVSEALFNPELFGLEAESIQSLVYNSINSIDIHTRKDIMNNLIIGGGTTMIKNFPERLKFECEKTLNSKINDASNFNNVRIYSQPEREYAAWIGGSIYCSTGNSLNTNFMYQKMSNSSSIWITKSDYEESGCRIFHRKYIV
jgi:centractin